LVAAQAIMPPIIGKKKGRRYHALETLPVGFAGGVATADMGLPQVGQKAAFDRSSLPQLEQKGILIAAKVFCDSRIRAMTMSDAQ
jgi:hypothetical protein